MHYERRRMADKKAMSRALGAAFLNHQVEQLEKPQPSPNPKRVNHGGQAKWSSQQQPRFLYTTAREATSALPRPLLDFDLVASAPLSARVPASARQLDSTPVACCRPRALRRAAADGMLRPESHACAHRPACRRWRPVRARCLPSTYTLHYPTAALRTSHAYTPFMYLC
ncbi:hypothetical protein C8R45DRAFT_1207895 [Mycena sanguinolenta]|nr:hypothetical protein C8R45DRAFT_1207895 [Mycena sanguinolenta]